MSGALIHLWQGIGLNIEWHVAYQLSMTFVAVDYLKLRNASVLWMAGGSLAYQEVYWFFIELTWAWYVWIQNGKLFKIDHTDCILYRALRGIHCILYIQLKSKQMPTWWTLGYWDIEEFEWSWAAFDSIVTMKNPCSKMVQWHKHNHPSFWVFISHSVIPGLLNEESVVFIFFEGARNYCSCVLGTFWRLPLPLLRSRSFYCAIPAPRHTTTHPTCSVGGAIPLNKLRHSHWHFRRLAIAYTTTDSTSNTALYLFGDAIRLNKLRHTAD